MGGGAHPGLGTGCRLLHRPSAGGQRSGAGHGLPSAAPERRGVCRRNGRGGGRPARWLTYFYVTDVDQAFHVATEQGGQVLEPPMDTPYGRMALLADPSGASFSVMTPTPLA
ncbi:VOC family protein [Deinococcus sonorensis]|uniref:VOC family protein n=1 Tax=Deinococcus sonorensis TaxID=309891 RepID=A0ABV8YF72_9DEIO